MAPTPHDALFKRTFSHPEHAIGELLAVLPAELTRHLDLSGLTLCAGSFVDEALSERHLYHGATEWSADLGFEALLDVEGEAFAAVAAHVPRFDYLLDDLSQRSDDELWTRSISAMGKLALLLLKHARQSPDLIERLTGWAEAFQAVFAAPGGLRAIEALVRYVPEVSEHAAPQAIEQALVAAVGDDVREAVMTAGQQLIEQGVKQGLKQGLKHGIEQGQQELLLKVLRSRFGELPDAVVQRVARGSGVELGEWAVRVITAADLESVFAD